MALTTTTLASACAITDRNVVVTAATGFVVGYKLRVNDEEMEVDRAYDGTSTTVPVLRGRGGSAQSAHVAKSSVTVGVGTDWSNPAAGSFATSYARVRPVQITTVSATGTLVHAPQGCDHRVILAGTSAITLTIPVPTRDMEGSTLMIVSDGAGAHVPTFTGGLGGAGTSYDAITNNATGRMALLVIAAGGYWSIPQAPALTGTVTNITGGVA
jgi:hypothetical protein